MDNGSKYQNDSGIGGSIDFIVINYSTQIYFSVQVLAIIKSDK